MKRNEEIIEEVIEEPIDNSAEILDCVKEIKLYLEKIEELIADEDKGA